MLVFGQCAAACCNAPVGVGVLTLYMLVVAHDSNLSDDGLSSTVNKITRRSAAPTIFVSGVRPLRSYVCMWFRS